MKEKEKEKKEAEVKEKEKNEKEKKEAEKVEQEKKKQEEEKKQKEEEKNKADKAKFDSKVIEKPKADVIKEDIPEEIKEEIKEEIPLKEEPKEKPTAPTALLSALVSKRIVSSIEKLRYTEPLMSHKYGDSLKSLYKIKILDFENKRKQLESEWANDEEQIIRTEIKISKKKLTDLKNYHLKELKNKIDAKLTEKRVSEEID